jgi:hypothetical protein
LKAIRMATKPAAAIKKLVVIDDSMLQALARQPQYVREFPFLKQVSDNAPKKKRGCGSCGGAVKATTNRLQEALNQAKLALVSMADDRKRTLKSLLNTQQARVVYKSGSKVSKLTF